MNDISLIDPSACTILAPGNTDLSALLAEPPLMPFSPEVMLFLQALSEHLLKDIHCRQHTELVALGFWLRKANLASFANQHTKQPNSTKALSKALGLVVHFTPANVDTMFVYSWVCSLLMGNLNIVRVASAQSQLRDSLISAIDTICTQSEFAAIKR